jgi:replicative DNA helicase
VIDIEKTGLPANLDAERAVLGAILDDESSFQQISAVLTVDDFSTEKHRRIFARMIDLHGSGNQIDIVTLASRLSDLKQLESAGGLTYISELNDGTGTIIGADNYIRIVKEKSVLRRYIVGQKALIDEALLNGDSREILDRAERFNRDLTADTIRDRRLMTPREIIEAAGGPDAFYADAYFRGIETPWRPVTRYITWKPKELTIIAARPSVGKTAAALQIAEHAAMNGMTVAFFSLEMSQDEILRRMHCSRARVDSNRVRRNEIQRDERMRLGRAIEEINGLSIRFDDSTGCTVPAIHAALRRLIAREDVGLVVIDYLQLMSAPGRHQNRTEAVSAISRGLKLAATDFNLPFIVLSQLTRACEHEGRRPQLSDLRESGSLEQDANNVLFLHLKEKNYGPVRPVELSIAKQRNGSVGTFDMLFHAVYCRLEEAAQEENHEYDHRALAVKS